MVMSVVTISLGKGPSEMHCFQLESAQTELMNFTSDFNGKRMTLMGGKLGQLETHLEIPVMRYHISLLLRYQTGL